MPETDRDKFWGLFLHKFGPKESKMAPNIFSQFLNGFIICSYCKQSTIKYLMVYIIKVL